MVNRCAWATSDLLIQYHDTEWGIPVHNDRKLFEMLVLESFQAGLSWETILKKRDNIRRAFHNFDPQVIAIFTEEDIRCLLENREIIRNKQKITCTINNAQKFLDIQKEFRSFDRYIWSFVDNKTIKNTYTHISEIPAYTDISDKISSELKKRGFRFIGSKICYAFMQAVGMVDDHTVDCYRYK
jgi:DNA-3-methyladenine glycosylase I